MKRVKKAFSIVPVATFVFCVAAATAFAGQHGFSGNINHRGSSHQVQVNHNGGVSVRHQGGYGLHGNHSHDGNVRVQANHNGHAGRVHGEHHAQTRGHSGFHF